MEARDAPGVIAFPPLLVLGAMMAALALEIVLPFEVLPERLSPIAFAVGGSAVALAAVLASWAIFCFKRAGTHVEPYHPALVLVEDGPYRFTRNPMYIGLLLLQFGLSFTFALEWGILALIPLAVVLHIGVILREEAYLRSKFGADYEAYLARSRRWL